MHHRFMTCGIWFISACIACTAHCAEPTALQEKLIRMVQDFSGHATIAVKHLSQGETVLIDADAVMPTASLIKVAVMVEAYRQAETGKLDLSQLMTLTAEDKVPGSGILTTHFHPGLQLSVRDAIRLMIAYSDNTATNLVLDRIGLKATADSMETLGFPNTKIHSKVYKGNITVFPDRSKKFGLGSSTARETLELFEQLHAGKLTTAEHRDEMLTHLRECQDLDRLPALLPARTVVAHKTGSISNSRTAAGIIESPSGPIAVVVFTAKKEGSPWATPIAGDTFIATVAKLAYEHFNPGSAPDNQAPKELREGAQGWLVEALQRTLNARMNPSPGLSVDGDFGGATKQAVINFQESQQISLTGIVDEQLWKALGPLITNQFVITHPEEFEMSVRRPFPADDLVGSPFVTCRAWLVGDPKSGTVMEGLQPDAKLENASTTKLMTALVAIREVQKNPAVLDELVTVSAFAAATPGSTANLEPGELLTVRDLLFALLLPSGNDAANVVAEHFGNRYASQDAADEQSSPRASFVEEMNRTAKSIGMMNTRFKNPHGLSEEGHSTTAHDLFRLASTIIKEESLLPYVQTRKHLGKITGASGYVRYELWTNTNRLLSIEGYLGMKTGTTRNAGACLVTLAERDGKSLVAVVLGATSSDARYTDTRNLLRWAWLQQPSKLE